MSKTLPDRSKTKWGPGWALRTVLVVIVIASVVTLYVRYISPTRVALVNYQGFQAAKIIRAADVGWVNVERFEGSDYSDLDQYDFVMIFGRGLSLNDQALADLERVAEHRMVIVDASMNPAHSVNSVPGEHSAVVSTYIANAGEKNYRNLLRYIRSTIQGKKFATKAPEPPVDIASDVLFHLGPNAIFNDLASYRDYYAQIGKEHGKGRKIALVTSVPGPFNSNRDHIDALISALEDDGHRVYPVASSTRRLELLKEIEPDLVIFMPHGRLHLGDPDEAIEWLASRNIPVLSPLSVFERYDDWVNDPQGFEGALLTMNVVLPELDGAIAPYVVNAQFSDARGSDIFAPVPGRLAEFTELVNRYLALKSKPVAEKKVGIVYFRGPGKNALTAGNLEVAESLYNTLLALQSAGYNVDGLPTSFELFQQQLDRQGIVMTPRAPGLSQQFLEQADPAFIAADEYRRWCNDLAQGLCEEVESFYGPAPGDYLVDDSRGLAVARLQFGNVAVLPQPLPGYGENTFKLVHGTDKAPPHTYLGAYFWLRNAFAADAVVHFGTHGSLEFTPSKQVALSDSDWSHALLGATPHFYLYTMSNVGEAIIAKRRSYATVVNHLTPPFSRAGLTSDISVLQRTLASYATTQGAVQEALRQDINQQLAALRIDSDLGIDPLAWENTADWETNVLQPAAEWLETLAQEKISLGLYTIGRPYSEAQAQETVDLMFRDTLEAKIESLLGMVGDSGQRSHRDTAQAMMTMAAEGADASDIVGELIGEAQLLDVQAWETANPEISDMDIIRGFVSLGAGDTKAAGTDSTGYSDVYLQETLARVMADPQAQAFITSLENDTAFSHVSKVLDPAARERAQVLSKVIPQIGEALQQLAKPDVTTLVTAMQDDSVREDLLGWMKSDGFAEAIEAAKQQRLRNLAIQAASAITALDLSLEPTAFGMLSWQDQRQLIESATAFRQRFLEQEEVAGAVESVITDASGQSLQAYREKLQEAQTRYGRVYASTSEHYRDLSSHIGDIERVLRLIPGSKGYLLGSTDRELASLINGLAGGYIAPSSGGDPVLNPGALPTGRNMYSIDAEKTPSPTAWRVGVKMAEDLIQSHREQHGTYPEKVAFTLWPSSFIHSKGATIAEILYLLGVEPVWDPFGRIQTLRIIPADVLGRPRIDVVVQSAGQLRDLAASRLALIEEAVVLASQSDDPENHVKQGVRDAEKYLLAQGQSPMAAKQLSVRRSFGGVNNSYGTGIMGLVESSHEWAGQDDIAGQYLQNMGALYGDSESWGQFNRSLLAAALLNTDIVVQPRSSNTWGALSLDHVYEFMGGLSAAVKEVTGATPDAYFNDFRNSAKAKVAPLEETIRLEARSSVLNPAYISAMIDNGGASSAETFAETFRNTFGWNAMRPEAIGPALWQEFYSVYAEDSLGLGLHDFFSVRNPYALQEMTGVMLEASRKGFWAPTERELDTLVTLHAQLLTEFEAGCGTFTCGNPALREYIESALDAPLRDQYVAAMDEAEIGSADTRSIVLVDSENRATESDSQSSADASPEETDSHDKPTSESAMTTKQLLLVLSILILGPALLVFARIRRAGSDR